MKHIHYLFLLVLFLTACKNTSDTKYRPASTGNPYDVLIIVPDDLRSSAGYDSLKNVLQQSCEMIEPEEPFVDTRTIKPEQMSGVLKKHRNIFMLRTNPDYDESQIGVSYDLYATPQMVVYIDGRNSDSLASIIHRRRNQIQKLIDKTEKERFVARMTRLPEPKLSDTIAKMFGIQMTIPRGYQLRNAIGSNFLWFSYEMPESSQGVFMYTYPIDSARKFNTNDIIKLRNDFGALIPGGAEGSYMSTSEALSPISRKVIINGRPWIETRGFWELENDFMGGPFVSYTTIDPNSDRVLCIDEYVYSPTPGKGYRNFLRQLESIVNTVSFEKGGTSNITTDTVRDSSLNNQ